MTIKISSVNHNDGVTMISLKQIHILFIISTLSSGGFYIFSYVSATNFSFISFLIRFLIKKVPLLWFYFLFSFFTFVFILAIMMLWFDADFNYWFNAVFISSINHQVIRFSQFHLWYFKLMSRFKVWVSKFNWLYFFAGIELRGLLCHCEYPIHDFLQGFRLCPNFFWHSYFSLQF